MAKLVTRALADDAVTGAKLLLGNAEALKARNNADNANINILNIDASDDLVFLAQPTYTADPANANDLARKSWIDTQLGNYILTSAKGAANGVASLDGTGRIPAAQLTIDVLQYLGVYNATTNSPTLINGTGTNGDLYQVNVAGTQDFGAGNIIFAIGDKVVYNGTIWEKWDMTADVVSVNGQSGIVVLDTDDLLEGTNLYFTDARAKAAAVSDVAYDATSWNGVTDVAPSKNAVRDEIVVLRAEIASAAGSTNGQEVKTLIAGDITNGYIDLAQEALAGSVQVIPVGWLQQEPGVDFTLSVVSLKTRITFAADLLELIATDKVLINYEY